MRWWWLIILLVLALIGWVFIRTRQLEREQRLKGVNSTVSSTARAWASEPLAPARPEQYQSTIVDSEISKVPGMSISPADLFLRRN